MTEQTIEKSVRLFIGLSFTPGLLVCVWVFFSLLRYLGIDLNNAGAFTGIVSIIIFFPLMIVGGLISSLAGCLLAYITAAKVFSVERGTMENIIAKVAGEDPLENISIFQRYYKWCLDVAYR